VVPTEADSASEEEGKMDSAAPYLKLAGRVLLSLIFITSGFSKITGYAGTSSYMEQHGLPGALLPLVILTQLGGGLLVLTGLFTRYAAVALAGFCLLTAYFFHYQPDDQTQIINFMKNIAIAGGFLMLAGSSSGALGMDNSRFR
jgi:putative oxidoreductase